MESSARNSYLVTEVMTATPQKLQLMLLDAAIRAAERARQRWLAKDDDRACEDLIHAQQIMGELIAGLDDEVDSDLVKKVASVYLFIFRSLMEANHNRDEKKLDDALKVLKVERETWRQVCEELGSKLPEDRAAAPATSPGAPLPADLPPGSGPADNLPADNLPAGGFSLEA